MTSTKSSYEYLMYVENRWRVYWAVITYYMFVSFLKTFKKFKNIFGVDLIERMVVHIVNKVYGIFTETVLAVGDTFSRLIIILKLIPSTCKGYIPQLLMHFHNITHNLLPLQFICDALRDLVPSIQFKKREKHPWRSVTFSKVAGF